MKQEKLITNIAIIYFLIGLLFAIAFAVYYRWPVLSFLSPNFYSVVISWPYQLPGFFQDFINFGLAGKPI